MPAIPVIDDRSAARAHPSRGRGPDRREGLLVRQDLRLFGLDRRRLSRAQPHALVMHPGPMNRGTEIASDVADGERSVILDQVAHGVAVRMAVLFLLYGSNAEGAES